MNSWIVYSRQGCTLCDRFMLELAELIGDRAAHVRVLDVDDDFELKRKYGERIPVLVVDGDFVCAQRLDTERVRRYMRGEK